MDKLEDSSISGKEGFFKHVFNFDDKTKAELSNIIQYSVIGLIPIIVLNKTMQKLVPEADENKGSVEILVECLLQIIVIFMGIFIIHRIITYISPHSGLDYQDLHVTNVILIGLLILSSLQTKLGEKINILFERVMEAWDGNSKEKAKGLVKTKQPISGENNSNATHPLNQRNMPIINEQTTSINNLPVEAIPQNIPDNNNSFRSDYNTNAPVDQPQEGFMNVMAANEALGGSFGSNF